MGNNYYKLFAEPSFLEGFARAIDIGDNLSIYNPSNSPEEADCRAIKSDWEIVGGDLRASIESQSQEEEFATSESK